MQIDEREKTRWEAHIRDQEAARKGREMAEADPEYVALREAILARQSSE